MKYRTIVLTLLFAAACGHASAQVKMSQDTLDCPLIGFHFGTMFPSKTFSSEYGSIYSLYKAPFLNFGLDGAWKYKSNWLVSLNGDLVIGADNLKNRKERMPSVFSDDYTPFIIGTNGVDANVTCYNRALSFRVGGGKIFTVDRHNPNSGIMAQLFVGAMTQKTIFMENDVEAPQVEGDYARLYDHRRQGFTLTESVGYWFMSNRANIINLYVSFDITQFWSHSTRDYVIDDYIGLHGPDNANHFDMLYTIKISWMFPLKGKTAYDYFFY